ncbi:MAG: LCP family protein [Limosilactobacillus sp.]|nr:LCP family protein [Limosilactobacillus sp.]
MNEQPRQRVIKYQQPPYHNSNRFYRILRWTISLIVIGIALLGSYEYYQLHQTATKVFKTDSAKIDKKLREGKPVSVLVMGTDNGAIGRNKSFWGDGNTDSMELVTANPKTKTLTMTSIPRDTLVKVTHDGDIQYVKINASYPIGGAKLAKHQVSELLGVPVDYYALVDMGVMEKIVTAVGGVDVNNQFKFKYEGHTFKKGPQHLNGTNALKYSRMRYEDPNNDYGRQKRQQQVIQSIVNKFKQHGSINMINQLLDATEDGVKTDLPLSGVSAIYTNYKPTMEHLEKYHLQGKDAKIDSIDYQVATPKEINRVSKLIRQQLGLKPKHVVNNETKLYNMQTTYNGYNNIDFRLPSSY